MSSVLKRACFPSSLPEVALSNDTGPFRGEPFRDDLSIGVSDGRTVEASETGERVFRGVTGEGERGRCGI